MTAPNRYNTWQDLLDEDDLADVQPIPAPGAEPAEVPVPAGARAAGEVRPPAVELPSDLVALMAEKERLQKKLDTLTGQAAPTPDEERLKKMYPVRVHTKETRIEERRLRCRDEHLHLLKQRALEHKNIQHKAVKRDFDRQEDLKRTRLVEQKQEELRQAQQQEILENQQRRDLEKAAIAQRLAIRQEEAQRSLIHQTHDLETLYERWDTTRQRLVQTRIAQRQQETRETERHLAQTTTPRPPSDDGLARHTQLLTQARQNALATAKADAQATAQAEHEQVARLEQKKASRRREVQTESREAQLKAARVEQKKQTRLAELQPQTRTVQPREGTRQPRPRPTPKPAPRSLPTRITVPRPARPTRSPSAPEQRRKNPDTSPLRRKNASSQDKLEERDARLQQRAEARREALYQERSQARLAVRSEARAEERLQALQAERRKAVREEARSAARSEARSEARELEDRLDRLRRKREAERFS